MIRSLTIIAIFLLAVPGKTQVLTASLNGHVRSTSAPAEKDRAILLPAIQGAVGDDSPDLLKLFSAFKSRSQVRKPPAIIAISLKNCGVHPNSEFLVFRQLGSIDVPILNSVAGDWALKDARHHSFHDIVLTNYQGVHRMISTWQYDGRRYRARDCIDQTADGTQNEKPANQCSF